MGFWRLGISFKRMFKSKAFLVCRISKMVGRFGSFIFESVPYTCVLQVETIIIMYGDDLVSGQKVPGHKVTILAT